MSEQDADSSPMRTEATHRNSEHNSLDDTAAANNSIIGKVKSRVSSIFPNSLSKWFSPSTRTGNDSFNGSINSSAIGRRRRRNEIEDDDDFVEEDDEEDVDDDDDEQEADEYEENLFSHQQDNTEDESNNSDEESASLAAASVAVPSTRTSNFQNSSLGSLLKSSIATRHPPTKRSRLNIENVTTNKIREPPSTKRAPLVASTPDYYGRGSNRSYPSTMGRSSNRYTHLNLYANQARKDPAYDFHASAGGRTGMAKTNEGQLRFDPDIIDLVPEQDAEDGEGGFVRSRRTLNIPPTTSFRNMKRPSLASVNHDLSANTSSTYPRRTSTTIFEADDDGVVNDASTRSSHHQQQSNAISEVQQPFEINDDDEDDDEVEEVQEIRKICNGRGAEAADLNAKRQKLSNGSGGHTVARNNTIITPEDANLRDSTSESSDGVCKADNLAERSSSQMPRKTAGLFNMSAINRHNGSRSSSFGNALNFYSHLEGRKSLFGGGGGAQPANRSQALNNSTLSLTSLNRRQFNASIYGSTSALSDSRLLNTFSPFYKGRTTYGGAAAYNKYSMSAPGAGANSVRITPTLIRPTSSLSTLSSSNNSIVGTHGPENPSAISSTAKRILDLINDFATPLSEAKKMASNLKTSHHQQQHPQQQFNQSSTKLRRFNETDLKATRAMRLSQVRTPYTRPSVTLQPKTGNLSTSLPPVRELQVPSMSQLLQMKKLQHTTERSRKITTQNSNKIGAGAVEYTLPAELESADVAKKPKQHTNKIKNKIASSARVTGSKDIASVGIENDETLAPLNLPNIAFPLMESTPTFDIDLPIPKGTIKSSEVAGKSFTNKSMQIQSTGEPSGSNVLQGKPNTAPMTQSKSLLLAPNTNFKFSLPVQLDASSVTSPQNITAIKGIYKFSQPTRVERSKVVYSPTTTPATEDRPQLKSGSVLDALKSPFILPEQKTNTTSAASNTKNDKIDPLFAQFKKSSNEWECDVCMIRNKQDATKCVACETSRKVATFTTLSSSNVQPPALATSTASNLTSSFGFGTQFQKSSDTWECEVCLIRNKQDVSKCVACETARKSVSGKTVPVIQSSFGDTFKPKANSWECSCCLIYNKPESDACVACGTRKTGSAPQQSELPTSESTHFKELAADLIKGKWECTVCMTRNDDARPKCLCCEQAKPGSSMENAPKFSFGSAAAAKFSFGFGTRNTPKEEELRKITEAATATTTKASDKGVVAPPAGTGFVFAATSDSKLITASTSNAGYGFDMKPASETGGEVKADKDTTDSKKMATAPGLTGFKFGAAAATISSASTTSPTTTSTTTPTFSFGSNTTAGVAKSTENAVTSTASSSIKFSMPATTTTASTFTGGISFDGPKSSNNAALTNIFSSTKSQAPSTTFKPIQQSSSSAGFSFGLAKPTDESNPTSAQIPETSGFSFKSPATNSAKSANESGSGNQNPVAVGFATTSTTVDSSTTAAAAVKPLFSFGATTLSAASSSAAATRNTTTTTNSTGFSFGSIASSTSTATAPVKSSVFGVLSPSTTTAVTVSSSTSAAAPAPSANIFGSFGASSTTLNNTFGAGQSNFRSPSMTPASSSNLNSTFGTVAAAPSPSLFGSFGSNNNAVKPKDTASVSVFGSPSTSQTTASGSFGGFGSSTVAVTTGSDAVSAASAAPTATTSTTWPKNSFVFGSSSTLSAASSSTINDGAAKAAVFGSNSFGSTPPPSANNDSAFSPIFGTNLQAPSSTNLPTKVGTFGPSAASNSLFGAGSSAPLPSGGVASTNNLFGSVVASNVTASSATPSAFGSSTFGGNSTSSVAAPKFGSTASAGNSGGSVTASNSFAGFGAAAAASSTTSDGASAAKKSHPAFNFGAAAGAAQSTTGGFNFSASGANPKPAFNFGASTGTAASFNFTGSTTETTKSTQPFQFGATPTPLPPVFNFSTGAVETTPNAPFQFNAGVTQPATSNIFAPTPTPTGPQTGQQARRKIRAPIRRLTPR